MPRAPHIAASPDVGGSQWPPPVHPGDPNLVRKTSGDRERRKPALASPYLKHGPVVNPYEGGEEMDYDTSGSMSSLG